MLPRLVVALSFKERAEDPVRLVSCGSNFTVVVTKFGAAWAWGEGRCGELGVGLRTAAQCTPARVLWPRGAAPCKHVTCGWAHVLAIDAEGHIFASFPAL